MFPSYLFIDPDGIQAEIDADWSGDMQSRKSTTALMLSITSSQIFWRNKRQKIVTISSEEA